jgi:hypothetical protein
MREKKKEVYPEFELLSSPQQLKTVQKVFDFLLNSQKNVEAYF